eukprot:gene15995-10995_t
MKRTRTDGPAAGSSGGAGSAGSIAGKQDDAKRSKPSPAPQHSSSSSSSSSSGRGGRGGGRGGRGNGGRSGGPPRAPKIVFQYGNYRAYYDSRLSGGDDPRLKLIKPEWITDKKVLDIGCNSGDFTVEFAKTFHAASVKGVDIDRALVARAKRLASSLPVKLQGIKLPGATFVPISFYMSLGPAPSSADNISFETLDYAESEACPKEVYDCVVCVSTVKWIHLNRGDDGVKRLFKKVFVTLKPGGCFIFEAQPWQSYRKKRTLTPQIRAMFKSIELKPAMFHEYLLETIGFKRQVYEDLGGTTDTATQTFATSAGCKRSMTVYFKD